MQQRDVFSDQASIASWALFTLHRKKLYEYRNANEQNISVKMSSPEHYEEGKTVAIVASAAISSGDLVQVGDVFAVALTDIPQGETGDGITEGVFMLPKLKTDDMKTGKKVYLKSGKVQLTNSGSDPLVGVVWADAGTSAEEVPVKLNV
ncbi:prophage protein [Escherichia coli]|nr:prophage protein [Escherichia coli]